MAKKKLDIEQVKLTPAMAADLLERNTNNRGAKQSRVKALANDMREGRWHLNGDTISIDENDEILDGQHRLMAVVESQVTIDAIIARGVLRAGMPTKDTGAKRSLADTLTLRGEPYAHMSASIASAVLLFDENRGLYRSNMLSTGVKPTRLQVLEYYDEHRDAILATSKRVSKINNGDVKFRRHWVDLALFGAIAGGREDLAADWENAVLQPGESSASDALRALRIRQMQATTKSSKSWIIGAGISAWNHFVQGDTVVKLKPPKAARVEILDDNGEPLFPFPLTD